MKLKIKIILKNYFKLLLLISILFFSMSLSFAQTFSPVHQDGKIYFKVRDNVTLPYNTVNGASDIEKISFVNVLVEKYGITSLANPFYNIKDEKLQKTYLLVFSEYSKIDELLGELSANPEIEYAEKLPVFKLFYEPNDPYYGTVGTWLTANAKWHLDRIQADSAWNYNQGSGNIKVAVLDNGIWINHPDLVNKIVAAVDIADGDNDPTPPTDDMTWSHGTHTSGLVGAETNNNVGVASIGFNTGLMAVKVGRDLDGALIAGYEGILWAADNGADVISMSWGTTQYYQTMQNIVNYAYNKGCVMVAAAGNDGNEVIQYPAGLHHVISVASTDESDELSSFSCYGTWIDVCGPGGAADGNMGMFNLLSTTYSDALTASLWGISGKYDVMSGTSMSCPVVAGLCGLMLGSDSTLTPEKLENILKLSCDNIDAQNSGNIGKLGAGRVNAFKAVKMTIDSIKTLVADFTASETVILMNGSINFADMSTGTPTTWEWSFPGGNPTTSLDQNPTGIVYDIPGIYPVTLTVSDGTNTNTETKTNFIIVKNLPSSVWIPQATAFATQYRGIRNISIVSPDVVWASAYDGSGMGAVVLEFTKTSDGGATWTPGVVTGVPSGLDISELFAINKDTAWLALWGNTTGGNAIFKTVDGGITWTPQTTAQFSGSEAFPNTVYFWDANNGICLGDPNGEYFEIYTTNDGGENWIRVPQANIPAPVSGEYSYNGGKDYCVVGNTIWFGTNKGNVFKSVDKGLNWTSAPTGLNEVNNITFSDENNGIVEYKVYNTGTGLLTTFLMKKTSDGGATWQTLTPQGDIYKSDIDAVPGKPGMYVSIGSFQDLDWCGSSFSLDYGHTWTEIDDSVQYTCVKFFDFNTGWAGGFNQSQTSEGIWKWMGLLQDSVVIYPEFIADHVDILVGGSVNFTDLSLGDINSWQWTFTGGTPASSGDQHPQNIVYNTAGDYEVTLVCSNSDTLVTKTKTAYIHVTDGASINENIVYDNVVVYPNPATDKIYIATACQPEQIRIYDMTGKLIWDNSETTEKITSLNISNWADGIYMIEVQSRDALTRQKFLKQ